MAMTDGLFCCHPARADKNRDFSKFNLIAHRGLTDPSQFTENTLATFERAQRIPIQGLEFDLRWTKDMEPVVFHDESLKRICGSNLKVHELSFRELRSQFPLIPHFEEVLKISKCPTLMIELKKASGDWREINKKLKKYLDIYRPKGNFYLISLQKEILEQISDISPSHFILVAQTNIREFSQYVLDRDWGGLAGHYLVVSRKMIERHKAKKQLVGVGFPSSLPSLYREHLRGVDFVFSNHGQRLHERHLSRSRG